MVECGHRADDADHDGHGVGVAAEAGKEPRHLFMQHGMVGYGVLKFAALCLVRQFAVEQQVAGLEKVAVFGQLVDRITTIEQGTFVAIYVGDFGFATGCCGEAGVVGEHVGVTVKTGDVHNAGANGGLINGEIVVFLSKVQDCGFFLLCHQSPPNVRLLEFDVRPPGRCTVCERATNTAVRWL